jgi:hypothetical protein
MKKKLIGLFVSALGLTCALIAASSPVFAAASTSRCTPPRVKTYYSFQHQQGNAKILKRSSCHGGVEVVINCGFPEYTTRHGLAVRHWHNVSHVTCVHGAPLSGLSYRWWNTHRHHWVWV